MKFANSSPLRQKYAFLFSLFLTLAVFFSFAAFTFADTKKPEKSVSLKSFKKKASKKRKLKNRKAGIRKTYKKKTDLALEIPRPRSEEEFEEDAEKREEWFMSQRAYPFNDIPSEARRKAWLSRPIDARNGDSPTEAQWQPIGPSPTTSYFPGNWGLTSGRINAIAVAPSNPQLILIGAATGGVWRSTDGGVTFASTSDNQIDLAVGSIAFAPSNNSIVYAGMGDKDSGYLGTGVLKSTDAGQTWTRVSNNSLPTPGRISSIEVDASNPNRVYVAQYNNRIGNTTFASGFWYSNDGGVNWTKTISGIARDLVRHPTQPNTFYLAMQRVDGQATSTGGVFKSIDAGLTWTRIYTSPFATTSNIKIAVTPAAPQNVYVAVGFMASSTNITARVEVSENEGSAWTNRGAPFDAGQLNYNFYLFVHPSDPNTIFVGTRDLWRSTNGGAAYTNITNNFSVSGSYTPSAAKSHPDQHHFYISPSNPNLMYIANDGGIWRSTDNANSFQSLNSSLSLTMFTSIDMHPTDPTKTYGGTQDNGTQKRNGNTGWKEFRTGDGGQTVIDPLDPSIVYSTYVYNTVYRNNNNGDAFGGTIGNDSIFGGTSTPDRTAFYPPLVGNDVDSTLYFGTYRLYISTNRGASWTSPAGTLDLTNGSGDTLSAIGVARSNTNFIYVGSAQGKVMVSNNAGAVWNNANNGLPVRFIKSITVSPNDPNTAYLTVSGYDSGHVFKTVNAGASWTDISGNIPNVPANTLLIDPRNPNTLYVGTDIGVFRSLTNGTSWETFNQGMPPTIITELDAQSNGLMQAATYGRGAYEINLNSNVNATKFDFDGDGKADISVFRPSNGTWYLNQSANGFTGMQFGLETDKLAPADYDGDGKTDVAVYRGGTWFLQRSNLGFTGISFGASTDVPAPADFDGDGRAEIAVFRPVTGVWYIYNLSNNQVTSLSFGQSGDIPVAADYDGDGKADIGVFRNGTWYLQRSQLGFTGIGFGESTDRPVPADFDGDGKTDVSVYRPSNGTWYLLQTARGFTGIQFGIASDKPAPADYDGDGKADIAIFRDGIWYLQRSSQGFMGVSFGTINDKPAPGSFIQ